MPPSFLVDEHGQLVDSVRRRRGAAEGEGAGVRPRTSSICSTTTCGRRSRARSIASRGRAAACATTACRVAGTAGRCSLVAEPFGTPAARSPTCCCRSSRPSAPAPLPAPAARHAPAVAAERPRTAAEPSTAPASRAIRCARSRTSCRYTKENLQAAVEKLEATNEELQATNEELVASNEELQSTNEELHSVNEELYTVNAEYQKKNAELQELNGDIEHLLNETDVATIFLDRSCASAVHAAMARDLPRVARTTSAARSELHPRPAAPDAHADIERPADDTVEAQTGTAKRCYFLRILPYRRWRGRTGPDGVVVTLTDIFAAGAGAGEVAQLSAIVESSEDAIVGSARRRVTSWNDGARRLFGTRRRGVAAPELPAAASKRVDTLLPKPAAAIGARDSAARTAHHRRLGHLLPGLRRGKSRRRLRDRARHHAARRAGTRSPTGGADPAPARFDRRSDLRHRSQRRVHVLQPRVRAPARYEHRERSADASARTTPADGSPYPPEQSPIHESMRHREQAHVDDEVLWRADGTSFPAEYLEPSDPARRRSHRRGRHVPRHHRAAAGRGGDP